MKGKGHEMHYCERIHVQDKALQFNNKTSLPTFKIGMCQK